ncbi:multidrug efflux RND transporter permease subunit [Halioxenophilus sp. WMMB6]|uniref:efflux RND transporter permease subunit n=1 Tax=Halioxenophilus sp. WMMB6 TaxID=3073815 RepID=UPI00295E628B|nr:multidrug efflux RND transporter permease subunit [Halioxenophilus sp. WMMB6]
MKFAHFFIDRPIFAGAVSMFIFLAGLIATMKLPISEYPEVSPPTIAISTRYPGANPDVIANTVAAPLEQELSGIDGLIYLDSKAQQDGGLSINAVFDLGQDIDLALMQVQNRIAQALPRLPTEVRAQGVTAKKSSPDLTMVVNLSSDGRYDSLYLRNYALLQVRDTLLRLPGAGEVRIFGAGDYAMRVWLDPHKMAARKLTARDVVTALREQNIQVAAGSIGASPMKLNSQFQMAINAPGRLETVEQFEAVIVKATSDGQITYLRDVARMEMGGSEYALSSLLDNQPAVALPIFLSPGANALELADNVRATMASLSEFFPEGVSYAINYDPTVFVRNSIHSVIQTLLEATLLVVVVVLVFLQTWRAALIPIIAVPVSIIGTMAALLAFGFSINTLTLLGLVLAVGIVVDDAIVVVENVERGISDGLAPKAAARRAMNEVAGPIVAISLVICAVFVPPALVGGFNGAFYQQFSLTIAFAAVLSGINSLTLSPALCALILHDHRDQPDRLQQLINAALGWFFRPFNRFFDGASRGYLGVVKRTFRVKGLMVAVYVGLVALAQFSFEQSPKGFVPEQDKGYLINVITLPPGASIERTEAVVQQVGEIALATPGVAHAIQFSGLSINGFTRTSNSAIVFLPLLPFEERGEALSGPAIAQALNRQYAAIEGAMVMALAAPPIRGYGPAGGIKLQLEDRLAVGPDQLYAVTQQYLAEVRKHPEVTAAFSHYEINAPQILADVDRAKAKRMGVDLEDLFFTLQAYLGSYYVNDFNQFGRTFRVMVQADQRFRAHPEDALVLQTRNDQGEMVPVGSLVELKQSYGANTVQRFNGYPSANISAKPAAGYSSGQAIDTMLAAAKAVLPPGMVASWTEITYQQVNASGSLLPIMALSVLLVFLVLAAQYESLNLPLVIILIVPMCLLSAIAGIIIMGSEVNIFTQVGLFVLLALAAKNAILIVEFAREELHRGQSIANAALEACRLRLRPIVMTSFAFIFGVLPLMIAHGAGAEIRQALGIAVFFGMLGVTLFGLFFTPIFFLVIQSLVQRLSRKKSQDEQAVGVIDRSA